MTTKYTMWPKGSHLVLLLICISLADARVSEKRRKDKTTTSERPHPPNICESEEDSKESLMHCYCEGSGAIRNVSKAECWIFNEGLIIDDPVWDTFQTQNRLQDLSFIVRSDGGLSYVPTKALRTMRKLQKLKIKHANIDVVYSFAFANLSTLREITADRNRIVVLEQNAFAHMPNLTTISMDENRIAEIGENVFVDLPSLQTLFLSGNNISIIRDGAFKHLVNLLELDLDKNSISNLIKNSFDGLGSLKRLDLRSNRLKSLGDFTFSELWNAQEILLDNNELKFISERAFDGLTHFKRLTLSENRLTSLTAGLFEGVRGLASVDLTFNRLHSLTTDDIRPILENLKTASSVLLLEDNPFICDCRLTWIHALRNETKSEQTKSSLERITCIMEPVHHGSHMDNTLDGTKIHGNPMVQNLDNRLPENTQHKVYNQKSHEFLENQEMSLDDENYDEAQRDAGNHSGHHNSTKGKKVHQKHLFQIPVSQLPCPEELKESTDAPLSRPSRGEVKDFRGIGMSSALRADKIVFMSFGILLFANVF